MPWEVETRLRCEAESRRQASRDQEVPADVGAGHPLIQSVLSIMGQRFHLQHVLAKQRHKADSTSKLPGILSHAFSSHARARRFPAALSRRALSPAGPSPKRRTQNRHGPPTTATTRRIPSERHVCRSLLALMTSCFTVPVSQPVLLAACVWAMQRAATRTSARALYLLSLV